MRAGAEKSTDTREIMNRYCKSGITRSILRCADAVTMLVVYGYRTLTNQNIETRGGYYSTLWYPPTLTNQRDGRAAISLEPRFVGEIEGTGEIAMPISASR